MLLLAPEKKRKKAHDEDEARRFARARARMFDVLGLGRAADHHGDIGAGRTRKNRSGAGRDQRHRGGDVRSQRSCLKVGPNNQWSSYEACVQTTHAKLAYVSCRTSVRQTRLSSCIDDIRADPCVSTRASTMRVASCTPEELCNPE
jgi:hypothetical protein